NGTLVDPKAIDCHQAERALLWIKVHRTHEKGTFLDHNRVACVHDPPPSAQVGLLTLVQSLREPGKPHQPKLSRQHDTTRRTSWALRNEIYERPRRDETLR